MKRFRTGLEIPWPITYYGSSFRLIQLLRSKTKEARVDLADDQIDRHRAGHPQLFCVPEGSGRMSGDEIERHSTRVGTSLSALITNQRCLIRQCCLPAHDPVR